MDPQQSDFARWLAPKPRTGPFFGQVVTIFHFIFVSALTIAGATAADVATAPTLACLIKSRRFILIPLNDLFFNKNVLSHQNRLPLRKMYSIPYHRAGLSW